MEEEIYANVDHHLVYGYRFDVFLSFRGADTRKNFTSHLHRNLVKEGICVFLDDEKLEKGERIGPSLDKAIEGSQMFIPVLSVDYASSKWCLNELVQMLEQKRVILPVFYRVDRGDVREQKGTLKMSFLKHEERYHKDVLETWRTALRDVGELHGWETDNMGNQNEADLINMIVKRVLHELNKITYYVAEYPVAVDSQVENLVKMLNPKDPGARIVGILGPEGIGKTTIAKAMYNRIAHHFDASIILDIRKSTSLIQLQNQLLREITKNKTMHVGDISRGVNVMRERIKDKKVLVILDGAESRDQIQALACKKEWLHRGSRIIITSRKKELLNVVNEIYKVNELDAEQSLLLFCQHAFGTEEPEEGYVDIAKSIALATGGIPSTIEKWGSQLMDTRCMDEWKDTLGMVERSMNFIHPKKKKKEVWSLVKMD
ncbi:TMV resistance protein N [Amborella trichopoda]|uniref:TIR domain-containing protein n=1 Tax=Amborella trichopoda TaxID=13333 RepID=W1P464_AMBTC|nr:TMV resistance protein N [Amborella trichopoda]ERN02703.1 hypothetical protein AMTR_s00085p00119470 [Amborella trichopoda]|eukprot:XP_006841028.1 TMV resistance protein N [Amborella trichopoda]